ncbi:arginine decarboxylase [Nitrosomonas supralitoralis]|uniref:Arginine decarboxylase n=1 Tax=Nitrosomonas supralitoralis TaxID=2116706 RepID=A0A2P7NXH9_9PROT|nr:arginine decarboxylase [Nitrosomonas supralitoralis]
MIKLNIRAIIARCYIFIACIFLTACVSVAPWERGNLAKTQMEIDPYPLQSEMQSHNYSSREAAPSHKSSSGGGGCGCY